jgi:predicted RNA-binding protein YlqC (UPF0109 family)
MIEGFVEEYVKLISSEPNKIRVVRKDINPTYSEIIVYTSPSDAGKLIGKGGNMIGSIKTLISGCKAKNGVSYKIIVNSK